MLHSQKKLAWTRIIKPYVLPSLYRMSAFSSMSGQRESSFIDQQIQELNEELECVFGSSDAETSKTVPISEDDSMLISAECQPSAAAGPFRTSSSKELLNKVHGLTHVDTHGKASMVDVSEKIPTKRVACASGKVLLGKTAFQLVSSNQIAKGDVLTVAKIAGISGAKQTGNLIPLCHNISLNRVQVNLELDNSENAVIIKAEVTAIGVTGVEMEALSAVSVAALTVYDMCKAVSKNIIICGIQLDSKTGGKSGDWYRSK